MIYDDIENTLCRHLSNINGCSEWRTWRIENSVCVHLSDINECDAMNGSCGQKCENNVGSYSCSCDKAGYKLYTADHTSNYSIPAEETGLLPGDRFYINHTCVRTYLAVLCCQQQAMLTSNIYLSWNEKKTEIKTRQWLKCFKFKIITQLPV